MVWGRSICKSVKQQSLDFESPETVVLCCPMFKVQSPGESKVQVFNSPTVRGSCLHSAKPRVKNCPESKSRVCMTVPMLHILAAHYDYDVLP